MIRINAKNNKDLKFSQMQYSEERFSRDIYYSYTKEWGWLECYTYITYNIMLVMFVQLSSPCKAKRPKD